MLSCPVQYAVLKYCTGISGMVFLDPDTCITARFRCRGAAKTNRTGGQADMLILCRRTSESLKIGDEVTVTVMDVRGNQVRFGIEAPRDIPVHREEIYERIKSRVEELADREEK